MRCPSNAIALTLPAMPERSIGMPAENPAAVWVKICACRVVDE
jgi:hypothetical protein